MALNEQIGVGKDDCSPHRLDYVVSLSGHGRSVPGALEGIGSGFRIDAVLAVGNRHCVGLEVSIGGLSEEYGLPCRPEAPWVRLQQCWLYVKQVAYVAQPVG